MSAMGLSDDPWCEPEEADGADLDAEAPAGEGGTGGGGELGEEEASASTGEDAPGAPHHLPTDLEQTFSSVAMPPAESAASAPTLPSPGSTLDVFSIDVSPVPEPRAPRVAGPPAPTQLGPPARSATAEEASPTAGAPAAGSSPGEDFLQVGWNLVNEPGIVYDEAGAHLRKSPTIASSLVQLTTNTKVQILKHNPVARWYAVVTDEGAVGYVADWLIWRHLPEGNANVYRIRKGDTPLGIAREHYGPFFTRWGQDLRFVVNALVYVNKNNAHNGLGRVGLAKKGSVTESWLRASAVEDVYIWLPSADYLTSIYEEVRKRGGGTGSLSFDTFAAVSNKLGAFSVLPSYVGGLAHGFLQNLGDTLGGITDLLKSIFTGEIIEDVKKLWSALSKMSIKDVVEALGSWAQSWAPRLTSENHFVRGHAWGYFVGYLCGEIAMFAVGGAALNAIKASKLATKVGQVIARVAPRLTSAVVRATAASRVPAKLLREAKAAVLKRFAAVATDAIARVRFGALIRAAIDAGVDPAAANRLARVLHTAGIGARKVTSWGDEAFTKLASNPRTLTELEATLPYVKSGRITGLEDWLRFGATKAPEDAGRTAAELREARRLTREHPEHTINVGGDARAPKANGDPLPSLDLSVEDKAGKVARSMEMTSVERPVTSGSQLSSAIEHTAVKVAARKAARIPVPGRIESIVQISLPKTVSKGKGGILEISRNGDVELVTRAVPPMRFNKGNVFKDFAANASSIKNHELVDAVTIVERETGDVLARIERKGTVWGESK